MDDLIRRADAQKASCKFLVEYCGGAFNENLQRKMSDRIKALPSAQPEEFEWCTDCKEYDQERHCCPRWTKVIRKTVDEIKAEPVRHGKWIDGGQYDKFFLHHERRCSECGWHVLEIGVPWFKYCPNCGARMVEE